MVFWVKIPFFFQVTLIIKCKNVFLCLFFSSSKPNEGMNVVFVVQLQVEDEHGVTMCTESSLTLRRLLVWMYDPKVRLKTLAALVDFCQGGFDPPETVQAARRLHLTPGGFLSARLRPKGGRAGLGGPRLRQNGRPSDEGAGSAHPLPGVTPHPQLPVPVDLRRGAGGHLPRGTQLREVTSTKKRAWPKGGEDRAAS